MIKSKEDAKAKGYNRGATPLNEPYTMSVRVKFNRNIFYSNYTYNESAIMSISVVITKTVTLCDAIYNTVTNYNVRQFKLDVDPTTEEINGLNKDYTINITGGIVKVNPKWDVFKIVKAPNTDKVKRI